MTLALALLGALTLAGVAASLIAWGVLRWIAQARIRRAQREAYWLPIQEQLERDCGIPTLAELHVREERVIGCGSSQLDESAWMPGPDVSTDVVRAVNSPSVQEKIRRGESVVIDLEE